MFNKTMTQIFAVAAGVVITLQPVTAFAADANEVDIEVESVEAAETVETTEETAEVVAESTVDAVVADDEEVVEVVETAEVTEETVDADVVTDETVATEETVEAVEATEDTAVVSDEVVEAAETAETTPVYDKKAASYLKTAAKDNALLSVNSISEGLAATNQVSRCREMATKLLVFQYKYVYGQTVIGTAYDMGHGDNNYIMLEMKDPTTGEIYQKYFDFYMQDSNGNNVSNAFKYHTVDRITIVEKDAPTGEKKIGFIKYPVFAAKSNGNVVMDINTYSQLLSDEFIASVENAANAE
ncbi:hypothetical protein [Butyrivibrio sp. FCS014]|uniref:hypothetical protein n=1 Tax=Butyrivibrio sp. FCS014 TaxID=1408304 RepID=UPI0004647A0D|nr:hypothetical protein [Butyrivibrio sp. FCS014]